MSGNADVLSDVLRAVRLTGAVFFDFELSPPFFGGGILNLGLQDLFSVLDFRQFRFQLTAAFE